MLLIFSQAATPRLQYILKLLLNEQLGVEFKITPDEKEFIEFAGPRLNYSYKVFSDVLTIKPQGLLFQEDIRPQEIQIIEWKKNPAFFETQSRVEIPFDLFAAAFYLVSRYEEYLPFQQDSHGRFEADQSISFKYNFLRKPLVNRWVLKLEEILKKKYTELRFYKRNYQYIPTVDIDMIYKYKGKGTFRNFAGYWLDVLKNRREKLAERRKVLAEKIQDPFDTYRKFRDIHVSLQNKPVYFLLTATHGRYDKNIHPLNDEFISMARVLYTRAELGIHPSYKSNENINILKWELEHLSQTVDEPITKSRQHYLKMSFPETYRNLIKMGVKEDYSMGYATQPGFRASIAHSFNFFDLDKNEETGLRVHPFMVMDVTLRYYLNIDEHEVKEMINKLIRRTQKVGGTFISLWHNESLSESEDWVGWTKIYEYLVKRARK